MNLLDLAIICLVISLAARGLQTGLSRQVGPLGGFVLGLIAGSWLASWLATGLGVDLQLRGLAAVAIVFITATIVGTFGEVLGHKLAAVAYRVRLGGLDGLAGAVFGGGMALVVAWLLAAMFMRLPLSGLNMAIQNSSIIAALDRALPPAPDVVARVERLVYPNGFPRVFTGIEPSPAPPVTGPNAAAINAAAAAGRAATVRIEGLGCGGMIEGSGFVVGPGLVATNAHVVAGIRRPVIYDGNGAHAATTVSFDPDLDFAVLRTSDLAAAPLSLASSDAARGTVGAVLGYPGGGPFTVSPAAVLDEQTAIGRNIYDRGIVRRSIYSLQAVVRPGNSGGPFISSDGTVVGVVFATSTVNGNVGYALTSSEVLPEIQAAAGSGAVSTGACAAE